MTTFLSSERFNYFSHLIGLILWIPLTILLVVLTWGQWDRMVVSVIYGGAASFLFFASSNYHKNKTAENERSLWRTLDHFAIFVMIAGTYTPVILVWFVEPANWITMTIQWGLTVLGLILSLFAPGRPRWIDPILYVAMGWVALSVMGYLYILMDRPVFWAMLAGGFFYTTGAVIYGFKKPNFKPGFFGFHELFHLFILAGALAHYLMILWTVT